MSTGGPVESKPIYRIHSQSAPDLLVAGGAPLSIDYTALSIVAAMQQNFDEESTAIWDRVFVDNIYKLWEELGGGYRWYQFGRYFENGTKEVYMTPLVHGFKSKTVFYGHTEVMIVNQERPWEVVSEWEAVHE